MELTTGQVEMVDKLQETVSMWGVQLEPEGSHGLRLIKAGFMMACNVDYIPTAVSKMLDRSGWKWKIHDHDTIRMWQSCRYWNEPPKKGETCKCRTAVCKG